MKITAVRLRQVQGVMPTQSPMWEDRLARPIDIYPEYRWRDDFEGGIQHAHGFEISTVFLEIDSSEGITGLAGPIPVSVASIIAASLRPLLLGRDPIAGEKLWDQMHRSLVHGRQGDAMLAISAVDCALWDLRGKWLQQPVYRLLGGPTRDEIPAYASMLGFSVRDYGLVHDRAQQYKELGYCGQKWFFRHGVMGGREGLRENIRLVETLRNAVGEDYDLMFDCWQSMDVTYAIELAEQITRFRPRWLEECVMADRIDSHRRIKEKTRIPMAGGEHEYTRWGFRRFFDAAVLDVVQPDIYWCGGLSETLKIAAYATVHDLQVIPHGHSSAATAHFSASQSPIHTPCQEYLVKWNSIHQHFLAQPMEAQQGLIHVSDEPGMGMALDNSKIENQRELFALNS